MSSPTPPSHGNSGPPLDNPILNAYETFVRDTPAVTRTVMQLQVFAWILSFFVDLTFGLANIPYFCIQKFEIYRYEKKKKEKNSFEFMPS
jgi:hypothetical protein